MKKYISLLPASVHFFFILCACTLSAYNNYCDYTGKKKDSKLIQAIRRITGYKAVKLYGDISASQYGFGFFAPNVRSSGCISLENNQQTYFPHFLSREAKNRFSVLENQISDFLLTAKTNPLKDSAAIKYDSLKSRYYDLLYKSVAARLYSESKCKEKVSTISYTIFEYSRIKAQTEKNAGPEAITMYQQQLILKN